MTFKQLKWRTLTGESARERESKSARARGSESARERERVQRNSGLQRQTALSQSDGNSSLIIITWYGELFCRVETPTVTGTVTRFYYSIYTDDLIAKFNFLKEVFYADDAMVLAPSIKGLMALLCSTLQRLLRQGGKNRCTLGTYVYICVYWTFTENRGTLACLLE